MRLNYTQSDLFIALSVVHVSACSTFLSDSFHPPVLHIKCLSPPLVLLHNECVCVCNTVWQTASIATSGIVLGSESWIRLSKPCGLGRRHALNHILSYRLCLRNLCHVTWEAAECVLSGCLRYTTHNPVRHLSFFVHGAVQSYKCHINTN